MNCKPRIILNYNKWKMFLLIPFRAKVNLTSMYLVNLIWKTEK